MAEIKAAHDAGRVCIAKFDMFYACASSIADDHALFANTIADPYGVVTQTILITEDAVTVENSAVDLGFVRTVNGMSPNDDGELTLNSFDELTANSIILNSSTAGSTKKFRITVDDFGTLSAVEV